MVIKLNTSIVINYKIYKYEKPKKNQKSPKKPKKNHWAGFLKKKTGFLPTLTDRPVLCGCWTFDIRSLSFYYFLGRGVWFTLSDSNGHCH